MTPLLNGRGFLQAIIFLATDPYRLAWQLGSAIYWEARKVQEHHRP